MYINFQKEFELDLDELHDPIILIGWPGIGLVGKIALTAIRDSIDAKLFLTIQYSDFPPKSSVENGKLEIPTAKVHYAKRESQDLFILTADYQPKSSEGVFEFSRKFCEKLDELTTGKIKMYISMGAMVSEDNEQSLIHISGTDENIVNSFLEFENTKIMEKGVVAGANGILPAWAGNNGYAPGICLLSETMPLQMINLDPNASKNLVALLKKYLNIDMDYSELDKKVEEMEDMIDKFKQKQNSFIKPPSPQKKDKSDSYFR
ncbi:MAG: hypothetical protein EU541_02880 [Promethearchaeota archaeon]|nr:MAG: hypothetical protein EU541_02880 [Candidatus Lokiarchaeota archaeon]